MIADNLVGKVYSLLTVLERTDNDDFGHTRWICKCSCGNITTVLGTNLKREHTTSCGCLNLAIITKHRLHGSPTYQSWKGMIQRCTNPKSNGYKDYGGRGITVCAEWLSFDAFLADMGLRPNTKLTIDRIENNKGYFKSNCRWASKSVQNSNKRKKHEI